MPHVYIVQNLLDAKVYVGATGGDVGYRWKVHVSSAINELIDSKFYNAIRKHGKDNFVVWVIAYFESMNEAYFYEKVLIRWLDSRKNGYNTAHGGVDGMRKEWIIAGVTYESMTAGAAAHRVPYQKMAKRLALGHTPEQAVGLVPMPTWKVGRVVVAGVEYASRNAVAEAFGLDPKMVGQRVNKLKRSLEQALGLEPPPPRGAWNSKTIDVNGVPMSYAAAARSIGYNSAAITIQMKRTGLTAQEVFETLRQRSKDRK